MRRRCRGPSGGHWPWAALRVASAMAKKPWRCRFGFHAYVRDVSPDEKWLGPNAQICRLLQKAARRNCRDLRLGGRRGQGDSHVDHVGLFRSSSATPCAVSSPLKLSTPSGRPGAPPWHVRRQLSAPRTRSRSGTEAPQCGQSTMPVSRFCACCPNSAGAGLPQFGQRSSSSTDTMSRTLPRVHARRTPRIATDAPAQLPSRVAGALREHAYLADRGLSTAVFLALSLDRPLLLEGEARRGERPRSPRLWRPRWCAAHPAAVLRGTDANQALYEWDYARQLLHVRALTERLRQLTRTSTNCSVRASRSSDLLPQALRGGDQAVLLVDEVDRGDDEFEAFLLEVLSDFQVSARAGHDPGRAAAGGSCHVEPHPRAARCTQASLPVPLDRLSDPGPRGRHRRHASARCPCRTRQAKSRSPSPSCARWISRSGCEPRRPSTGLRRADVLGANGLDPQTVEDITGVVKDHDDGCWCANASPRFSVTLEQSVTRVLVGFGTRCARPESRPAPGKSRRTGRAVTSPRSRGRGRSVLGRQDLLDLSS